MKVGDGLEREPIGSLEVNEVWFNDYGMIKWVEHVCNYWG